jgi:hypothetical protein
MRVTKTRWFLPAFSLFLGLVCLVAFWLGGHPRDGVQALVLMAVVGLVFLLGGRSDTIRGLRGDGRDERFAQIDLRATAFSGLVLITAVLVMCFWEWGHGRSGSPYSQLGAIAGLAYIAGVIVARLRT